MSPPIQSFGGKRRKMKGGGNQLDIFGSIPGLPNMNSLLSGTPFTNSSPHVQPIEAKYGSHNMPLV